METLAEFIVKHRLKILILLVCLTVFFAFGVSRLKYDVSLKELIPPEHPFFKLEREYGAKFGGINTVVIEYLKTGKGDIFNVQDLKKIDRITKKVNYYEAVDRYLTMSITMRKAKVIRAGTEGVIHIDALVWNRDLSTPEKLEEVRRAALTSPFYAGSLVSRDGKATLIVASLKPDADYSEAFQFFRTIKHEEENQTTKINIVGRPILLGWIYHLLPQMKKIFAISGAVMLLLLLYFFRGRMIGLIVPAIEGVMSAIWGLGFMGFVGWSLNPLMIVIPFMIGAVVVSHSVQNTLRYYENYGKYQDKEKSTKETIKTMFLPTACGIATDTCGFTVLALAQILIIQKIAISRTFWMFSVFLFVSVFGPVLYMYLPAPRRRKERQRAEGDGGVTLEDRLCMKLAQGVKGRARWLVVIVTAIIAAVGIYFGRQLEVGNTSPGTQILWPDSEYNLAVGEINERFDNFGTDFMMIYAESKEKGGVKDPYVLSTMDSLKNFLKEKMPEKCGGAWSFVPIVKKLNMEFHESDPKYFRVPRDKRLIGSLLWLYEGKQKPGEMKQYRADESYRLADEKIFFKDERNKTITRALELTQQFFRSIPQSEVAKFIWPGGRVGLQASINEAVRESNRLILVVVLGIVFLFLLATFRSIVGAVMLMIPLILSNIIAEAFMVIRGVGLTIHILPLAAIGLSLGIDFGVYLYNRYKEEFKAYPDMEAAIVAGAGTVGRGVLYSGLTLVVPVLSWFFFSGIRFWGDMGLFLAILIGVNFVCALVLHPALVAIIRPKFIRRG